MALTGHTSTDARASAGLASRIGATAGGVINTIAFSNPIAAVAGAVFAAVHHGAAARSTHQHIQALHRIKAKYITVLYNHSIGDAIDYAIEQKGKKYVRRRNQAVPMLGSGYGAFNTARALWRYFKKQDKGVARRQWAEVLVNNATASYSNFTNGDAASAAGTAAWEVCVELGDSAFTDLISIALPKYHAGDSSALDPVTTLIFNKLGSNT